jgi:hypothetical protein
MIFHNSKIQGVKQRFHALEETMLALGFSRWTWDYEKVTYDLLYKLGDREFYLRVPGKVIGEKQLEHPKALIELGTPVWAEHFFPHGLNDEVEVPETLSEEVHAKLAAAEAGVSES